jgi:ABC-type proline/glycine betaine transport system permease subunit
MDPDERPPTVDADYRVIRGPWPRWMLHMSLIHLAVRTAIIIAVLIGIAVAIILRLR